MILLFYPSDRARVILPSTFRGTVRRAGEIARDHPQAAREFAGPSQYPTGRPDRCAIDQLARVFALIEQLFIVVPRLRIYT
jgi:hypothetical protein